MNCKESLIFRNQFFTQINASLSNSMNESRGLYSPPHIPFQGTVYANEEKHYIISKWNPGTIHRDLSRECCFFKKVFSERGWGMGKIRCVFQFLIYK